METTAAQPKSRRRWYQYGLRTLLILVTLAGVGFAVAVPLIRKLQMDPREAEARRVIGCKE